MYPQQILNRVPILVCLCWSLFWVRYNGFSFIAIQLQHSITKSEHNVENIQLNNIAQFRRSFKRKNDAASIELVHIPKTGGEIIEQDAYKAGIVWGQFHWQNCPIDKPECVKEDWLKIGISLKDLSQVVEEGWELWQTPPSWFPEDKSPYKGKALFTVVQNPYDRIISQFYCPQFGRGPDLDSWQDTPVEFNKFIQQRLSDAIVWTAQYLPQSDFIFDENGKQVIDHILKYENLTSEFAELMTEYEIPVVLNRTDEKILIRKRKMTADDLSPESIGLINKVAERDFRLLGYEMKRDPRNRRPYKSISNNTKKSVSFLFMMTDNPMNEELWEQWFPAQNDTRYSIFVHGIPSTTTVPLGRFFCRYAIPSVPTQWYWLHYGMMQALKIAFDEDPYAQSFIFVSASSIPLVSFDELYQSVLQDNGKSRFCFTDSREINVAWNNVINAVGLNKTDVRKAEMWSVISRSHARLLLSMTSEMDKWHETFKRINNKKHTGAPDETFFPTMLNLNFGSDGFHECGLTRSLHPGRDSCCPTHVVWNQIGSAYLKNQMQEPIARISDKCTTKQSWANPCTFSDLHEEGLIALRNEGALFLRKVTVDAVVRTVANKTIPLNDALMQIHSRKAIKVPELKNHMFEDKTNEINKDFQCDAPVA